MIITRLAVLCIAITLLAGFGFGNPIRSTEHAALPVDSAEFAISLDDADAALSEEQRGEVVAQFAAVAIDSLPLHRPERYANLAGAFAIVTRGEIMLGESLGFSLHRQGISPATVHVIASELGKVFDFRNSRPGDHYRLAQDGDGQILDFRYFRNLEESFYLAWEGSGYTVRKEATQLHAQISMIAGVVDSSLYGAIKALGEQTALASEFAGLFAWDIDFSRNVHAGDEFSILYERLYRRSTDGEPVYVRPGRILAGRYNGAVGHYTVVHYGDHEGGSAYYRPDGSSVERAFLAAPLEFSRISSRFSRARHHPILNVTRPHLGIDYAAPRGTPVYAVAEGVVEFKGRAGASGNLVRIRHLGGYTSHYAHLSRFKQDLAIGDHVDQKQIMGYVGSTGLATGPHVCFRVKKNGHYVDPMKISSPAGDSVQSEEFDDFIHVRDQLLAHLDLGPVSLANEAL
jgi:murein DD-endopeptidase MepM/ murein hydrolase activator NlpD